MLFIVVFTVVFFARSPSVSRLGPGIDFFLNFAHFSFGVFLRHFAFSHGDLEFPPDFLDDRFGPFSLVRAASTMLVHSIARALVRDSLPLGEGFFLGHFTTLDRLLEALAGLSDFKTLPHRTGLFFRQLTFFDRGLELRGDLLLLDCIPLFPCLAFTHFARPDGIVQTLAN
ncbi:MAG: hypothetical protein GY794_19880 [bacterium]|nr:hypothetical protein [bacterium]